MPKTMEQKRTEAEVRKLSWNKLTQAAKLETLKARPGKCAKERQRLEA